MNKKEWHIVLIVVLSFTGCYLLFQQSGPLGHWMSKLIPVALLRALLIYLIVGIPIFVGTMLIHREPGILHHLGGSGSILQGIGLSLFFTCPMLAGGFAFSHIHRDLSPEHIIKASLFAGLFEELYFRGFLFGQVFRYTRIGFIPVMVISAVLFAAGHMTQSTDPAELAGVFFTTFMGAVLFAWLYVEWHYNLWVPVFLHTFMNLSWELFPFGDTAAGTTTSNILRGMTIALAIVFTIVYKRKRGSSFGVNRNTLLFKAPP